MQKTTISEKIQEWYGVLLVVGFILGIILFAALVIYFMPGTESGLWYNRGV